MKKSLLLFTLIIFASLAVAQTPEKRTLSSYRITPATGKDEALKKAIAAHAAKYHTGNWTWKVYSVLSGPDEGAYMINEGPNSWTDLEGRKDISAEHQKDYENNVLPLAEKYTPELYLTFDKELSSDGMAGTFKKALLRHYYLKPGKGPRLTHYMITWKKVCDKMGLKVVAWRSFFSGQPQIVISARLTNGWLDLEKPIGKEMAMTFDEIAGAGMYTRYMEDLESYVDRIDEEMIEFLPELSSR
jgi:hypothetical protein